MKCIIVLHLLLLTSSAFITPLSNVKSQSLRARPGRNVPVEAKTHEGRDDALMFYASESKKQPEIPILEKESEIVLVDDSHVGGINLPFADLIAKTIETPQVDVLDLLLILFSSFLVAVGTIDSGSIPSEVTNLTLDLQEIVSYIFGFAFFLRWYGVGKLKIIYLANPLVLIDILVSVVPLALLTVIPFLGAGAMVPSWMMSNSGLVNLRLLRILRLQKVLVDMENFSKFEMALGLKPSQIRPYQLQLARVLSSVFTLVTVATGLIYTAEHEVNPDIPDFFTALYFGLTTLTTVGFGDITPVTLQGRLIVMGSILVGVAVIPAQAASLAEALLDLQAERLNKTKELNRKQLDYKRESEKNDFESMIDSRISCQTCGVRGHWSDALYCWSCGSDLRVSTSSSQTPRIENKK